MLDNSFVNLLSRLNKPGPKARQRAIQELAKIRGPEATSAIARRLKDPNPEVRTTACETLGKMRAHAAKTQLYDALNDRDAIVCCSAAEALAVMGDNIGLQQVRKLIVTKGNHHWAALRSLNAITGRRFQINAKGLRQAVKWVKSTRL